MTLSWFLAARAALPGDVFTSHSLPSTYTRRHRNSTSAT